MQAFYALRNFICELITIAEHVSSQHEGRMPETHIHLSITAIGQRAIVDMEHVGVVGANGRPLDPMAAIAELARLARQKYVLIMTDATEGRR